MRRIYSFFTVNSRTRFYQKNAINFIFFQKITMKKPKNLPDSAPESGEKKQASTTHELVGELSLSSKKETKLEFAIPVAPGVDSAYFD